MGHLSSPVMPQSSLAVDPTGGVPPLATIKPSSSNENRVRITGTAIGLVPGRLQPEGRVGEGLDNAGMDPSIHEAFIVLQTKSIGQVQVNQG